MIFSRSILNQFSTALKRKIRQRLGAPDLDLRLENLSRQAFVPDTIIDVGAFRAEWSRKCKRHFPNARILLVKPQRDTSSYIQLFLGEFSDCETSTALLGAESGTQLFLEQASNSRIIQNTDKHLFDESALAQREVETLDSLVAGTIFEKAAFLKIDAQGYELDILRGAQGLLPFVEVVQLEVSTIQIGPCPLFHTVMQFMEAADFRVYDIFEPNYRPRDSALWQIDVLFVRKTSALVESRSWS